MNNDSLFDKGVGMNKQQILEFFNGLIGKGKRFPHVLACAQYLGMPTQKEAAKFYRFLDNKADTGYGYVCEWLEKLGVDLVFPKKNAAAGKEVCFVNAKVVPGGEGVEPPEAEDYLAAPMVGEVGAGPGYIPQEYVKSWFLVYRNLSAVRYRRNLIAVEIGENSTSMMPTLLPGDIVLVDRDDREVRKAGRMMLVLDPDGAGMIKRVSVKDLPSGDSRITYYSDNAAEHEPVVYSLKEDFYGDWERSIVGRVIWAWSDVTEK